MLIGNGTNVLNVDVNAFGVTAVHTLINTDWGSPGANRLLIEFFGSDGAFHQLNMTDNDDIRDWNQASFANNINGVTTERVVSIPSGAFGTEDRMDKQSIALPEDFHDEQLLNIRFTDNSEINIHMAIVSGITVDGGFAGPCDDSAFIAGGASSCTPLITGLVGGPAAAGLLDLTLDPEDPEVTEDATLLDAVASAPEGAHLALLRMDVGPTGYDEVFEGFDMLLLLNLTDAPLGSPALGIDPEELHTEFMVPLTTGFEVKEDLPELAAHSVYALLIPEDGTIFNLSYTAEVDGEMVEVVASGLRVETDGRSFIPEPNVLATLGAGFLPRRRRRRRHSA